jgi:hypothetical protein
MRRLFFSLLVLSMSLGFFQEAHAGKLFDILGGGGLALGAGELTVDAVEARSLIQNSATLIAAGSCVQSGCVTGIEEFFQRHPVAGKGVFWHEIVVYETKHPDDAAAIDGIASDVVDFAEPPDCEGLRGRITLFRNELSQRYFDLLEDRHGLYKIRPVGLPPYGSWSGHVAQYEGWQSGLRSRLNQATALGCSIPAGAWTWATRPAPIRPSVL